MVTNSIIVAYELPTTVEAMNYNSVILVGTITLSALWWIIHGSRHYPGPKVMQLYIHDDAVETNGVEVKNAGTSLNNESIPTAEK